MSADPLERANPKPREPQRFAELKTAWGTWNATMLPLDPTSNSGGFEASELADISASRPTIECSNFR